MLENRTAIHAGDGNSGTGNRQSLAVNICFSRSGGPKYTAGVDRAARLVAQLMKDSNVTSVESVVQHNKWSGSNCPARMRAEGSWNAFIETVTKYFAKQ